MPKIYNDFRIHYSTKIKSESLILVFKHKQLIVKIIKGRSCIVIGIPTLKTLIDNNVVHKDIAPSVFMIV